MGLNKLQLGIAAVPNADAASLFSVYERTSGSKIFRDSSLTGISGTFDLQTAPSTKEELLQALRIALRDHFNIDQSW